MPNHTEDLEFDYQILQLTSAFYHTYPNPPYVEILKKQSRAYNCLVVEAYDDIFVCIPYRTHITHNYAYHFRTSVRSQSNQSGLDYTKMIIVKNPNYLTSCDAVIDNDEFIETALNIKSIYKDALSFLTDYIRHQTGDCLLHKREFKRRYAFSPLKYFHNELGISEK